MLLPLENDIFYVRQTFPLFDPQYGRNEEFENFSNLIF